MKYTIVFLRPRSEVNNLESPNFYIIDEYRLLMKFSTIIRFSSMLMNFSSASFEYFVNRLSEYSLSSFTFIMRAIYTCSYFCFFIIANLSFAFFIMLSFITSNSHYKVGPPKNAARWFEILSCFSLSFLWLSIGNSVSTSLSI